MRDGRGWCVRVLRVAGLLASGFVLALLLAPMGVACAEDDPAVRKAKIEEARKAQAEADDAFKARVNTAIERGIAWLRTQQKQDGSYPGFSEGLGANTYNIMEVGLDALVVLTLAHGGADPKDVAVRRCLDFCRFHYSGGNGSLNLKGSGKLTIYTAATLVLALDALYNPGAGQQAAIKKDRYGEPVPPKTTPCKYPSAIRKWIQDLVQFVIEAQVKPSGGWRYPGNPLSAPDGDTDLSNTQYALLALDAAARCGIKAPPETWRLAAEYVLREQDKDGLDGAIWVENEAWEPGYDDPPRFTTVGNALSRPWTYLPGDTELPTGSMTAAGLTCLAMCKEHLWLEKKLEQELRGRIDRGLLSGMVWLGENFSVEENPTPGGASQWHYYYLYGLERAGLKIGTRYFGKHDWYREGGEHLLGAQEKTGGWKEPDGTVRPADSTESAITQTCFAILFLKRTTREPYVPMMPPVTGGGGGAPADGR
ncbi:MAG: hypothetical protein O2894_02010 [Planctomycetota bacterium]|nr:hypothetical protein [Planctomycetota bacterium]